MLTKWNTTDSGEKPLLLRKMETVARRSHLVEGQYADRYYLKETSGKIRKEINEKFDRSKNVQLVVVDISGERIHRNGENVTGVGGITPFRLNREKDLWGARAGSAGYSSIREWIRLGYDCP